MTEDIKIRIKELQNLLDIALERLQVAERVSDRSAQNSSPGGVKQYELDVIEESRTYELVRKIRRQLKAERGY